MTVYNGKGEKINGKVLTTWLFWAKVQHAKTKQTTWVKNYKVDLVVADKAVYF